MPRGKIIFQLSGSIACYKACELISLLKKDGFDIKCIVTESAPNFIGIATLEGLTGNTVSHGVFTEGEMMDHIHLARWADLFILCPATANTINKLATGIANDLISTLFLAQDFSRPYIIAPAMNTKMLMHPATVSSLNKLRDWGIDILDTEMGELACGENGIGRLLPIEEIRSKILGYFQSSRQQDIVL